MAYVTTPGFGGLLDFAKDLIPAHTIVGKAIRGDTSGAAQDATKYAAKVTAKAAMPKATSVPVAAGDEIGTFAPGGWVDRNQTYLLLGAAGLVAFLVLGRKGRR